MDIRINIIYGSDGWILERWANVLFYNLSNSCLYDHKLVDLNSDELNNVNSITYWFPYFLFNGKKTKGINVSFFTHPHEPNNPEDNFVKIAKKMDYNICMCRKYKEWLNKLGLKNVDYIIPGVEPEFKPRLNLGVFASLRYADRKGVDLLNQVKSLDFVNLKVYQNVPFEQIPELYQQVDYVLVTSKYEGGPQCVLEALASGKQIICPSDIGYIYKNRSFEVDYQFEDDYNFKPIIYYRNSDVKSLIDVLDNLYYEKEMISNMVKKYTYDNFAKGHLKLFRKLLNERNNCV